MGWRLGFVCIVFDAGIDLENCLVQFTKMLKKIEEHWVCGIQMPRCDAHNVRALGGSSTFLTAMTFSYNTTMANHCVFHKFKLLRSCILTIVTHLFNLTRNSPNRRWNQFYPCRWLSSCFFSISLHMYLSPILAQQIKCHFVTRLCYLT